MVVDKLTVNFQRIKHRINQNLQSGETSGERGNIP